MGICLVGSESLSVSGRGVPGERANSWPQEIPTQLATTSGKSRAEATPLQLIISSPGPSGRTQ